MREWVEEALRSGADWVQIREKTLAAGELADVVEALPRKTGLGKLLVNERADVALAAGLDGIHLPADSMGARRARAALGAGALVGVSCHGVAEARAAEEEGASFVALGPVFQPNSKPGWGPPIGLGTLEEAARAVSIPVLALGGVGLSNARACRDAGAAGVAGIGLFQRGDMERLIRELKAL